MLSLQNMISRCRPLLPVSGVYMLTNVTHCQSMTTTWAPSQYPKRRLSVRSRKVSKPRDLYLELSDRSEIWQALRQQCCRCVCQISKRYDNLKYQFEAAGSIKTWRSVYKWWRHQMETLSALLAFCAGNSPVNSEFPSQRPVSQSLDVFFNLRLNKRLSKQLSGWWFETPSRSLLCHCNAFGPWDIWAKH